jgi:HlyD family secretion protein
MTAGRGRYAAMLLPIVAGVALLLATASILHGEKDRSETLPRIMPPVAPPGIAGVIGALGLVEAETEQVNVAASVPGVVVKVEAVPGQRVRAGELLFAQDLRAARAEVAARQADVATAEGMLVQARNAIPGLRAQVAIEEAAVQETELAAREAQDLADVGEGTRAGVTISVRELTRRRSEANVAKARARRARARLEQARAELAQYVNADETGRPGAEPDGPALIVARSVVAQARANLAQAETAERLHSVLAPFDGTVLQVNIRQGEFAAVGPGTTPLVSLGRLDRLRVRVDIEEADIPRFAPGAPGWASPRGKADLRLALTPIRVEPLVVPKLTLGGAVTERVDTRVLRVVYAIDAAGHTLYPGQQMDVFISGVQSPLNTAAPAAGARPGAGP